jgi:hypothetical protein
MINLLLLLLCALLDRPSGSDRNDWLIDGLALLLTACLDTGNKLHNSSCVKRFSFVSPPLDLGNTFSIQYFIHFFFLTRNHFPKSCPTTVAASCLPVRLVGGW